jgi:hypothetical protein
VRRATAIIAASGLGEAQIASEAGKGRRRQRGEGIDEAPSIAETLVRHYLNGTSPPLRAFATQAVTGSTAPFFGRMLKFIVVAGGILYISERCPAAGNCRPGQAWLDADF